MLRRRRNRRGLALMMVLSLLILFLLMGISFLMVASQSEKGARAMAKVDRTGTKPRKLLDNALYQVLRDTNEVNSPLRTHSLLNDMYGVQGFAGVLGSNATFTPSTGNQFIQLNLPAATSNTVNYYAGRVLTFVTGRAKGISVRVVGYDPTGKVFHVMRGEIDNGALPQANDWVFVNGPAFSGTGFAYSGPGLGAEALRPNKRGQTSLVSYLRGGANESYDAVDFQNMVLAAVIPDGTGVRIIPSFHRPALIRQSGGSPPNSSSPNARTVLRPLPGTNPGDAGPGFPPMPDLINGHPINGPWDVDNDNDGIPDSIWIDLGLPVQSTVDGRAVKPLFAILCVDLDGRLNLNVHGNESHINPPALSQFPLASPGHTSRMPKGSGYGPAEINLRHALAAADVQGMLQGAGGVAGRYGADNKPGRNGFDTLAGFKFFEHPNNYSAVRSTFNSPDDLNGWLGMGLNENGQTRYSRTNANTKQDTPYEINVSQNGPKGQYATTAADQPFSIGELERVLRANDLDSVALPRRLWELSPGLRNDTSLRKSVTTDSYDFPVAPPVVPTRILLDDLASVPPDDLVNIVPSELLKGSRMDINRPFGDGADNNNNDVFDESYEFPSANLRQQYAQQLYVLALSVVGRGVGLTDDEKREIAQWAVNVVDFRDADSIMSRFVYDTNPYDGWTPNAEVWGCERPELLISESLAWHDRRTYDMRFTDAAGTTNEKTTATARPDEEYDQWWVPRGAFFVELFNPWDGDENRPGEFYASGGSFANGVILNKTHNGAPAGSPVWRLTIVKDRKDQDPDDPVVANRPTPERLVYFTRPPGPADPRVFYPTDPMTPVLAPGRYAVIGSGGIDRDGGGRVRSNLAGWMTGAPTQDDAAASTDPAADFSLTDFYSKTDTRQLSFQRAGAQYGFHIENNGFTLDEGWPFRPIGIPIPGLTISEPIGGYSPHFDAALNVPTNIDVDTVINPALDIPLDLLRFGATDAATYATALGREREEVEALNKIGTTTNFRMIHLQRLADPTQPFNANTNPYRTIDSMSVDLTAFNGAVPRSIARAEKIFGGAIDVETIHHASLQRGDQEDPAQDVNDPRNPSGRDRTQRRLLWKHQVENQDGFRSNAPADAGGLHLFAYQIRNTLGSLNSSVRFANGGFRPGTDGTNASGFPAIGGSLTGYPTFPLLTWNNRPFISQYELTLVPKSRSSRLLHDYSVDSTTPLPAGVYNPYDSRGGTIQLFGHLPNFFDTNGVRPQMQWHRILDYTHVPSRFIGTETVLNPSGPFNSWPDRLNLYRFPTNKVATFREPGKININTIYDERVWRAIMDGDNATTGHGGPTFGEFVASRRGYNEEANIGGTAANILAPNNSFPTYFANPIRMGKTGDLVPITNMEREDIQCTLLRGFPDPYTPDPAKANRPMFELTRDAAFEFTHLDNRRNPVMRNHALTRIANLTTTRSNVYAIWITVGYFEVDKITGQLGAEKGSDTGEISRHRAFYMVDRSIPVAFQPGENHNVDRCILVRRFIE